MAQCPITLASDRQKSTKSLPSPSKSDLRLAKSPQGRSNSPERIVTDNRRISWRMGPCIPDHSFFLSHSRREDSPFFQPSPLKRVTRRVAYHKCRDEVDTPSFFGWNAVALTGIASVCMTRREKGEWRNTLSSNFLVSFNFLKIGHDAVNNVLIIYLIFQRILSFIFFFIHYWLILVTSLLRGTTSRFFLSRRSCKKCRQGLIPPYCATKKRG